VAAEADGYVPLNATQIADEHAKLEDPR